ncbi:MULTISPECIES: hypothetical protein [unclassified Roseateles]|uniref:hypothetical protein n=1 Tax=unclassified Roseateles TaxID=2626991 RepID=UPI000ADEF121|nr:MULTISPECIES: hypothetical protein [unclassified Roseateles]
MGEAFASDVIKLIWLCIAWLIAITISFTALLRRRHGVTSAIVLMASIASLPVYFAVSIWHGNYRDKSSTDAKRALAEDESVRYQKLCSNEQQLSVSKTVPSAKGLTIRIHEASSAHMQPLDIMKPVQTKDGICWTTRGDHSCTTLEIENIEWVEWNPSQYASWCTEAEHSRPCHRILRYATRKQSISEINSFTATLELDASRSERISPLIDRFRITVKEPTSPTVLAETFIYRKAWFTDLGPNPNQAREPTHCPDRDVAIGKLLDAVTAPADGNASP